MYSIFSDYLSPLGDCVEDIKPSEVYDRLRIAYNQGAKGILDNTRLIASRNDDEIDYDIIYEVWRNKPLHDVVTWINKKILLQLGKESYQTIDVRIRIATGMLNKLVTEKLINKKCSRDIHENLIKNLRWEMSAINTEDLPF